MPYSATNDYAALDATKPLGSEDAGLIDDIFRETRLVAKTVTEKVHSSTGQQLFCSAFENQSGQVASAGSTGTWARRAIGTTSGITGTIATGSPTFAVTPVAGIYLVFYGAPGCKVDKFMVRLAVANSNTTVPSDSTAIDSVNAAGCADSSGITVGWAHGVKTVTADGATAYCVDMWVATNNGTDGYGRSPLTGTQMGAYMHWLRVG